MVLADTTLLLDGNLYVGTSASELLHFFQVPADPADKGADPVFILASRLRPPFSEAMSVMNGSRPGVQQILLLPRVNKACVLCNFTITFYSLPEMSPVWTQVKNCNWIGGVDMNEGPSNDAKTGVTILMSMTRKIQLVRIGVEASPRVIRKIDFQGSTLSVRRDSIACVADSRSYALLEVDQQLKIPLMSISSLDDSQQGGPMGQAQNIAGGPDDGLLRSASSAQSRSHLSPQDTPGHTRSTSLGNFITGNARRGHEKRASEIDQSIFQEPDSPAPSRSLKLVADKPLPKPPTDSTPSLLAAQVATPTAGRTPSPGAQGPNTPRRTASPAAPAPVLLKPLIASPTPEEFLLVTGTGPLDPGIGIFVNLDGDPTRPTVEFERYPRDLVVDGGSSDISSPGASVGGEQPDGYVLASMTKEFEDGLHHGLEIQRFDINSGEDEATKHWLEARDSSTPLGVRSLLSSDEMHFQEVADKLCRKRFSPFAPGRADHSAVSLKSVDSRTALSIERVSKEKELLEHGSESDEELPDGWESVRMREEQEFVARFTKTTSRLAVWTGNTIWWAVRNPLLLQLEASLQTAALEGAEVPESELKEHRTQLLRLLNSIRGRDPKTELEFMTFSYIRQRASVVLLTSFLRSYGPAFTEPELKAMEEVLLEGGLDPRVVLAMIPPIRNEIVESRKGIWIFGGVKTAVEEYIASDDTGKTAQPLSSLRPEVIQFIGRFLTAYRRQKGFGSIADENDVFRTVDAALLLVLLELDQGTPGGAAKSGSVRQMLYELVDHGVDCFDRAVDLLESYHRLFVLSRLYQSRKMASDVLATWRRIIEGERDDGGELGDGEQKVRTYLKNISSQALVQEYGIWLANRNPKLGVQVFADDKGRAPKFDPAQVVTLLRQEAPDAVKYYLEHLVFGKGHTTYVNELITYYLDIVITNLQSSPSARETVSASYEAYRALRPPKPTYHHFLQDNTPPDNEEVWHSRLRLLQLLGGAHDYDSQSIRERITTAFPDNTQLLVPEAIILDGRQHAHENALRLLVHRLGDYDTAVSYCLRGGSSIYTPPQGRRASMPSQDTQTRLFRHLLREFMAIEDGSDRVEQTGALLSRFGGWFDVLEVLELIPDGWSVDIATEFLVTALRRLVRERHEGMLERALSSSLNLRVNWEVIERIREKGAVVDGGE